MDWEIEIPDRLKNESVLSVSLNSSCIQITTPDGLEQLGSLYCKYICFVIVASLKTSFFDLRLND